MLWLADVGNTRIKIARVDEAGSIVAMPTLRTGHAEEWPRDLPAWGGGTDDRWSIASVNPTALGFFEKLLRFRGMSEATTYRSAADVPLQHRLAAPARTGADRALAVLGTREAVPAGLGAVVVLCGTAITVERVAPGGIWDGGAIAAGYRPTAKALHDLTAQLPLQIGELETPPGAWGDETGSALRAGLWWGLVGACRELVGRLRSALPAGSPTIWTGGDAKWLAGAIDGPRARVDPDLIFRGLLAAQGR